MAHQKFRRGNTGGGNKIAKKCKLKVIKAKGYIRPYLVVSGKNKLNTFKTKKQALKYIKGICR